MRIPRLPLWLAGAVAALWVGAGWVAAWPDPPHAEANTAPLHSISIVGLPRGPHQVDVRGTPVNCSTCHSARSPRRDNRSAGDLDDFHQGLAYRHGNLSCLSCHGGEDYDALRLADGTPLPFSRVMELCGQCHGPQRRDYDHGSHGGMQGYWDLRRGGRTRNACIVCHDPHAPAFPQLQPVFAPQKGH